MFEWISFLIPRLEALGAFAYWVILFISFLESFAFVGLIIPGTSFMVVAGIISSQGIWDVRDVIAAAVVGGVVGDGISFYLGKRGTTIFNQKNKIFKLEYLEKGEQFFLKHGEKSIFLARFFGPLRPVVPFVAGFFKMSAKKFFLFNILSALVWAPFYILIGYFFGQTSGHLEKVVGRVGVFFAVLCIVVAALFLFKRSLMRKGQDFFISLRSFVHSIFVFFTSRPRIHSLIEHHPKGVYYLKQRTSKSNLIGLPFTLFGIVMLLLVLSTTNAFTKFILSPSVLEVDQHIVEGLFIYRHSFFVQLFLFITYLGSSWALLLLAVVLPFIFWTKKRYEYIVPFYITVVGSVATVYLMKLFTARPRPHEFSVYAEQLFSFPSLHSIMAFVVYGFFGYFLIQQTKNWKTKLNILFFNTILILAVGFSRIYLGVHFFSDVVAGHLLGVLWLWIGVSLVRVAHAS